MSGGEKVLDELGGDAPIYAVLDGARDDRIVRWIRSTNAPAWCLYSGKLVDELEEAAPWMLRVGRGHRYTSELFEMGWGQAWGFFLACRSEPRELRRHLRKHLLVRTEDGRRLVFRYYDPRVLRAYLPTCTPDELRTFLGPIAAVAMERDDDPPLIVRHPDGAPSLPAPRSSGRGRINW